MNEIEIKQKLDRLAKLHAKRNVAMFEKQRLIDEVYTAEIKSRMAEIEEEFEEKTRDETENIAALEADIKQSVIAYGTSVKGATIHAVFAKGCVSWDTKSLNSYAIDHPELLVLCKKGEPSVSIRVLQNQNWSITFWRFCNDSGQFA